MSVSDQTQSTQKRPGGDLITPEKRTKILDPELDDGCKPLEASTLSGEKTITYYKFNEFREKVYRFDPPQHQRADIDTSALIGDKGTDHSTSAQAAGDCLAEKILEKPQFADTDNDSEMLSFCAVCNKNTNHDTFNCPDGEKVRRMLAYCMVCNRRTDHFTSECPNATKDVLEKLQYCMLCNKNTDHNTFNCPNKETGFVWYKGAYVPNICDLCNNAGHLGEECPLDQDKDLYFDPPVSAENFQQGANASENVATGRGFDNDSGFPGRNSRSMNFVRDIIDQDGRQNRGIGQFQVPMKRPMEQNADVVRIKLKRNNTFVTVTDSKGNKKLGASAGSVPEMKGGAKLSRYAAEATAEYVGRMSRNFGLKSVVMRVKGFTYFKKKKTAILAWKDGFTNSRVGQNPVIYIEDTSRKPHNGCRLRKQRRV